MNAGNTALHFAAVHGHLEVVRQLLADGRIGAIGATGFCSGRTALEYARDNGHVEIAKLIEIEALASVASF
eukprot:SAG11_NODE_5752_length_1472_cov_1.335033_1_plen_71_part_00